MKDFFLGLHTVQHLCSHDGATVGGPTSACSRSLHSSRLFSQALAATCDVGGLELSETLTLEIFFKSTVFTSNDTVVFLQEKFKTKRSLKFR